MKEVELYWKSLWEKIKIMKSKMDKKRRKRKN
jgi:hypothetical protein